MFIPIRPRQPGDPPPPPARVQMMYAAAFALIMLAVLGAALYLGGRPLF